MANDSQDSGNGFAHNFSVEKKKQDRNLLERLQQQFPKIYKIFSEIIILELPGTTPINIFKYCRCYKLFAWAQAELLILEVAKILICSIDLNDFEKKLLVIGRISKCASFRYRHAHIELQMTLNSWAELLFCFSMLNSCLLVGGSILG